MRGGLRRAAAGAPPFPGRPGTRPSPQASRLGEAAAGAGRRPPPQQLAAARGAAGKERRGVRRGLQKAGPSPASSLPGAGREGWPRKGGAPGRAAGGPRGAPRTKGDGDDSSVVKTTCAGGGPRPGRGLGALHLNPFAAAAASFLHLVGGRGPAVLRAGEGWAPAAGERRRDRTQARRAPRCPLLPSTSHLPAPPPFPPGFRVDLPTHCYVRLGGVGGTDPTW